MRISKRSKNSLKRGSLLLRAPYSGLGKLKVVFCFLLLIAGFGGCDLDPFETLGPSEHGVVFSALPPFLGGGVKPKVYAPKQKVFLMWW